MKSNPFKSDSKDLYKNGNKYHYSHQFSLEKYLFFRKYLEDVIDLRWLFLIELLKFYKFLLSSLIWQISIDIISQEKLLSSQSYLSINRHWSKSLRTTHLSIYKLVNIISAGDATLNLPGCPAPTTSSVRSVYRVFPTRQHSSACPPLFPAVPVD